MAVRIPSISSSASANPVLSRKIEGPDKKRRQTEFQRDPRLEYKSFVRTAFDNMTINPLTTEQRNGIMNVVRVPFNATHIVKNDDSNLTNGLWDSNITKTPYGGVKIGSNTTELMAVIQVPPKTTHILGAYIACFHSETYAEENPYSTIIWKPWNGKGETIEMLVPANTPVTYLYTAVPAGVDVDFGELTLIIKINTSATTQIVTGGYVEFAVDD